MGCIIRIQHKTCRVWQMMSHVNRMEMEKELIQLRSIARRLKIYIDTMEKYSEEDLKKLALNPEKVRTKICFAKSLLEPDW